jgi:hypothetical protein
MALPGSQRALAYQALKWPDEALRVPYQAPRWPYQALRWPCLAYLALSSSQMAR